MGGWDWKILQIKFYIVSIHLISLIYFKDINVAAVKKRYRTTVKLYAKELLCGLAKAATTSTEQEEDSGQRCCGDGWWRHDKTDSS
uniref:Uncharacterized protein n=1 Tax=Oryza punctata TaxID=4537 RepID=A0A0E0JV83_ORYPU